MDSNISGSVLTQSWFCLLSVERVVTNWYAAVAMNQISRRKFLNRSVSVAGLTPLALTGFEFPFIRSVRAAEPGANDKVRLGLIGSGGMGQGDLECFFLNPEVDCAVVCDVDDARVAKGVEICEKKRGRKPDTAKDFRRVL